MRIEKPLKKGERRTGMLVREESGICCFDETEQQWLNNPVRRTVRLKVFPKGTRVSRKDGKLIVKLEIPVKKMSFMTELAYSNELTDAMSYVNHYIDRRAEK